MTTPATLFAPNCALITGNTGGAIQGLPQVPDVGGKVRAFIERVTLAAQASGAVIMVARIPVGARLLGINVETDTSLSTATLAFGDANSAALFSAAATLTATNAASNVLNTANRGVAITGGYDGVSGAASSDHEDILMTVGTAALPGSGNLVVTTEYTYD